jgi:hypothetical protein
MGSKKAEVIDIVVDELALSLVGCQVEDAQARLVTESHNRTDYEQQVAFSDNRNPTNRVDLRRCSSGPAECHPRIRYATSQGSASNG